MPRKQRIPSLRRHKPSSQGVVTLNNTDFYLGRWPAELAEPPPEVRAAYDARIAEWLASGRGAIPPARQEQPSGPTVEELLVTFWAHVEQHYRHPDGQPTSEVENYVLSLRPLRHLYAGLAVLDFTPKKLKAVRELMIHGYEHPRYGKQPALARGLINQRIGRIVRMFKWGVEEEMVPVTIYQALKAVRGLKKGRSDARETKPVKPVDVAVVEATLPYVLPHVAGMARLQMSTGMRPGEVCRLRLCELDRSTGVWIYRPAEHKTAWKGKDRIVAVGSRGQDVLREFIKVECPLCGVKGRPPRIGCRDGSLCGPCADRMTDEEVCGPWPRIEVQPADDYLFCAAEAMAEFRAEQRSRRKSKVQPSQKDRKKVRARKKPRERYDSRSYAQAITKGIEKANTARVCDACKERPPEERCDSCRAAALTHWHPHQIRHSHGTEVRKRFGLEAAQVALGHSQARVTELYAERDLALAVKVASEIG